MGREGEVPPAGNVWYKSPGRAAAGVGEGVEEVVEDEVEEEVGSEFSAVPIDEDEGGEEEGEEADKTPG